MSFTDTGFVVRLLSEEDRSYYTTRVLELQNTMVSLKGRQIKNMFMLYIKKNRLQCSAFFFNVICEVETCYS